MYVIKWSQILKESRREEGRDRREREYREREKERKRERERKGIKWLIFIYIIRYCGN